MLRTVLRRGAALAVAAAALLSTLVAIAATPAAADPTGPHYSCPGAVVVGGTAPGYSSENATYLKAHPSVCGQRIQRLAYYGLRRDTWEPRRKVLLPDGRAAFEYQQYFEDRTNDGRWVNRYTNGTVRVLLGARCVSGRTAIRSFKGVRDGIPYPTVFRVQFTNLNFCYNGASVWFRDEPQWRVYVASTLSAGLQGACAGTSKSATDPANANQLQSVFITCQAVFSNKQRRPIENITSTVDRGTASRFRIPGLLNAGIALPNGFVSTPPAADQFRYYTIRITADGCYTVSGVGTTARTCF